MAHYQPWQIYAMQKLTLINFLIASFEVNDKDEVVAVLSEFLNTLSYKFNGINDEADYKTLKDWSNFLEAAKTTSSEEEQDRIKSLFCSIKTLVETQAKFKSDDEDETKWDEWFKLMKKAEEMELLADDKPTKEIL